MTMEPTRSGWPYTAPSRCACQAMLSGPAAATPAATPVRAASRPNVGQAAAGSTAAPGSGAAVVMSDGARLVAGAGLSGAGGTEPLQAAAATSTTSTPSTVPANATLGMFSV